MRARLYVHVHILLNISDQSKTVMREWKIVWFIPMTARENYGTATSSIVTKDLFLASQEINNVNKTVA